jgi:protein TonB
MVVAFFVFLNLDAPQPQTASDNFVPVPASDAQPLEAGARQAEAVDFSVRLNRARLALDAGMLIEPEGYSAWSIYAAIVDEDADNTAANEGLNLVASRLIDESFAAVNAGRRDAAAEIALLVLSRFPGHTDAAAIIERTRRAVIADRPAPEAVPALPETRATETTQRSAATATREPAEPELSQPADPIPDIYSKFTRALADGQLLEPAEASAGELLAAMRAEDSGHAMTQEAGQQLFEALYERHNEAFNELGTDAALQWLDAAEDLQIDAQRIAAARDQILDFVAVQSATEPITAAELTLRDYVPPRYPPNALRRGIEGWVDVAFVLSRDGSTTNVEATDASNSIFRAAATQAVRQWAFEPHTVHERVVEQHAHTRIRFVLED